MQRLMLIKYFFIPRLQSLNIGWIGLTSKDIDLISKKLPSSLVRLNISGCRQALEDQRKLLCFLKILKSLDWIWMVNVYLKRIVIKITNLKD